MVKLILVFEQLGYHENDGGIHIEYPRTIKEMDTRCNELLTKGRYGDKCTILCAGELSQEYKYLPVEKVTVFERKQL